jgi:hypothetical protein
VWEFGLETVTEEDADGYTYAAAPADEAAGPAVEAEAEWASWDDNG